MQTINPVLESLGNGIGGYYESLPADYNANADKKYPLIIFLHGSGEVGDGSTGQLPRVLKNGLPKVISQGKFPEKFSVNGQDHSFIVVAPQVSTGTGSGVFITTMLAHALKKYRVDAKRIFITGLSLGGMRCYNYLAAKKEAADKIAAALLVCPGIAIREEHAKVVASSNIPMWVTNNNGDPAAKVAGAITLVDLLNAQVPAPDPKAKLTVFTASGHDAWTKTYDPNFKEDGKNVYEWMLGFTTERKVSTPAPNPIPDPIIIPGDVTPVAEVSASITIKGPAITESTVLATGNLVINYEVEN